MRCVRIAWIVGLAAGLAWGGQTPVGAGQAEQNEEKKLPPVLRSTDPSDTGVITLPGATVPEPAKPAPEPVPAPAKPAAPREEAPKAVSRPAALPGPAKVVERPAPPPAKGRTPSAPSGQTASKPSPLGEPLTAARPTPAASPKPASSQAAPGTPTAAPKPAPAKSAPAKPAAAPKPVAPVAPKPAGTAADPHRPSDVAGERDRAADPNVDVVSFAAPEDTAASTFEKEGAQFLHSRIGRWGVYDAQALLGKPRGQRPAVDENQAVNGRILAFADPSGRYQELELDFDKTTGLLRTVFVYPFDLTWEECQHRWGAKVSSTLANKGRTFYSYQDRRLDVLVAPGGRVISLGLY